MEKTKNKEELHLTRMIDATPPRVFQAWTDPTQICQWWGPHGFTAPGCELDVHPEGAIRITMRGPDGKDYPMTGTFHEIIPPTAEGSGELIFSSVALDEQGKPMLENTNTITFTGQGDEDHPHTILMVHVKVDHATEAAEPALEGMPEGWNQTLDRLKAFVEGH
jgi:uncharacterized protein YndB with AHSA1/START domain